MPRLFVAIALPAEVSRALAAALPPDISALRRVAPELLHVTLAFIGAVAEERVSAIADAVDGAVRAEPPFLIRFERLGRFPDRGPARMVWAGTGPAAERIERLGGEVRQALARDRVPFDPKPLRPHVTLARVRDGASERELSEIAAAVARARLPAGLAAAADAVHLMESVLSRGGPRYSSRARSALTGAPGGERAG